MPLGVRSEAEDQESGQEAAETHHERYGPLPGEGNRPPRQPLAGGPRHVVAAEDVEEQPRGRGQRLVECDRSESGDESDGHTEHEPLPQVRRGGNGLADPCSDRPEADPNWRS